MRVSHPDHRPSDRARKSAEGEQPESTLLSASDSTDSVRMVRSMSRVAVSFSAHQYVLQLIGTRQWVTIRKTLRVYSRRKPISGA